jgi:hypothetical protein
MEIKVLCRGSEAGHSASDLFCSLSRKEEQIKETQRSWNLRDLGVGREPFTLQNVHEPVLCVWLSVCWEFSVVADQKCF